MKLSAANQEVLNSIVRDYGDDNILCIQSLANADFTDPEDMPSGIVTVHPINSVIIGDSLPNNSFDYLVICPIRKRMDGREWTDSDFKNKESAIHKAVPQFSENPVTLKSRNVETNMDAKRWEAEFGENDASFAGIFKQSKGRDTNYYVAVQAGAPLACQQLRERLIRNPMTFKELLNNKEYMYCDSVALRNAQRLAYAVARAVNADIKYHADVGSLTTNEFESEPWRANPKYTQPVSSIMPLKGGNTVGVFNKVTPTANVSTNHFVYEGPYNGIAEYVMKNNTIGYGLPSHTGRHEQPKVHPNPLKRSEGVICESIHPKDHPDITHETFKSTEDDAFKTSMKKYGWRNEITRNNLIPVVIKVYDPTIKRK